ncbi:MAG TPA: antibiotic biosynthesis monooxygenase [Gammaproteobacteria bacterium]|nr:antibiotic biosynthesis monooxygenase [Gammaproteobacteria bacterium]
MTNHEDAAETPQAACYAVIFTSLRSRKYEEQDNGYEETARRMLALASRQPGFLSVESARDKDGFGITVSYWRDLDAIKAWRKNIEHREAQRLGRAQWYEFYNVRICKVEKEYGFSADKL